jgi:hypothetical protein
MNASHCRYFGTSRIKTFVPLVQFEEVLLLKLLPFYCDAGDFVCEYDMHEAARQKLSSMIN